MDQIMGQWITKIKYLERSTVYAPNKPMKLGSYAREVLLNDASLASILYLEKLFLTDDG